MRAVAFIWEYHEEDILGHVVRHLSDEGVSATIFTDTATVASWAAMLRHTEVTAIQYAKIHGAFWAIHHDADEIRRSPIPGERLRDFFERVHRAGWNAVDHHVQVFAPRDGYDPVVHHPETYFTEPFAGHMDDKNGQIKAWWQTPDVRVDLASSGGHKVKFEGRKVCPEKLLLKHYPMRGAQQRAAKAKSRAERWAPEERVKGWHQQYIA